MNSRPPSELLYDSEAALRLVDNAIQDIGALDSVAAPTLEDRLRASLSQGQGAAIGLLGLSDLLARSYAEILGVLDSLRQSRSLLERATVEKIHHTHDKLREVTDATETAATDILNGLERANALVDQLDGYAGEHGEPNDLGAIIRATMRDELFALIGHMQFQDITSQQLNYASAVLTEMETRLAHIARVLDPAGFAVPAPSAPDVPEVPAVPAVPAGPVTFDPNASTQNRAERQAIADQLIATNAGA